MRFIQTPYVTYQKIPKAFKRPRDYYQSSHWGQWLKRAQIKNLEEFHNTLIANLLRRIFSNYPNVFAMVHVYLYNSVNKS